MHLSAITVDRGLCVVLTMMTGAALFAAEAMGVLGASPSTVADKDHGDNAITAEQIALGGPASPKTERFGRYKNAPTTPSPNAAADAHQAVGSEALAR